MTAQFETLIRRYLNSENDDERQERLDDMKRSGSHGPHFATVGVDKSFLKGRLPLT